jgi:hypothetical protein
LRRFNQLDFFIVVTTLFEITLASFAGNLKVRRCRLTL